MRIIFKLSLAFSFFFILAPHLLFSQDLMSLIPHNTATHTAVQDGSWFDASTWNSGTIPGDGAIVIIPTGKSVSYEGSSDAHIFAVRIDGTFTCIQTDSESLSELTFDTFIGTHMSTIKFLADNTNDGEIKVNISPFDIEAQKLLIGTNQIWNANAIAHFSDNEPAWTVEKSVGPDSRFNSYAEAIAGNTSVSEVSRITYNECLS